MSDDFRVPPRSNVEVRKLAKKLREYFGVASERRIDVLSCLRRPQIWTVNGVRPLQFAVRPDDQMPNADGFTVEQNGTIFITVRQSAHYNAYMGVGHDRNTIAHELGHAVLGHASFMRGAQLSRRPQVAVTPKWIRPFESAEHHVNVFAPAFLINDEVAKTLSSPDEIAVEFGISLQSATIYFEQLTEHLTRSASTERVLAMAREVRDAIRPKTQVRYLDESCTTCGNRTLIPLDMKTLCVTCETVSDRFQDGDRTGD